MSQLEHKSRLYTLVGVALALFLGALDQTIVSTAMPRIVSELNGLDRYTWVTTIYLLISTLLVPIYGKLADIRSRRGLEIFSVSLFLLGSALCGLAGEFGPLPILGDGMDQLIIFRGIQGLGGAGIFALAFIIVSDLYPPKERGKINGMFGAVFGLASVLGPLAGGFLTDFAGAWLPPIEGWRWVFYVNIPIGALALWFIITKMPRLHAKDHSHKINLVSVGLMLVAFFPLVLGLQLDKDTWAWNSPLILSLLGASAIMLAVWIWHSLRTDHPILDLRLFKTRMFTSGSLATFFFGASFMTIIIFLPLYMVNVLGVSATSAGASVIPMSMGVVVGAGISGPVVSKLGKYKAILIIGTLVTMAGVILLSTVTVNSPSWQVIVYMILVGVGFGPAQSLYSLAIQNTVDPRELGQATATIQFSRQIGSVIGAALLGVVFTTTLSAAFSANMPGQAGSAGNMSLGKRSEMTSDHQHIKQSIIDGLDKQAKQTENLLALRGADIEPAYQAFMNDPNVDEHAKSYFADGTPALSIPKAYAELLGKLKPAILQGDVAMAKKIIADASIAKNNQPGLLSRMPDIARQQIIAAAQAGPAQRQAAWPVIEAEFMDGQKNAIENASAMALTMAMATIEEMKANLPDQVVNGIQLSFAQAITRVWFLSIFVVLGTLLATLFLPSIKLRGRGEPAPSSH